MHLIRLESADEMFQAWIGSGSTARMAGKKQVRGWIVKSDGEGHVLGRVVFGLMYTGVERKT